MKQKSISRLQFWLPNLTDAECEYGLMVHYLPFVTRGAVACYCPPNVASWTNSLTGPGMVCSACRKPSPMTVLRVCMWCDKQFILAREHKGWRPLMDSISNGTLLENEFGCFECEPDD